MRAAYAATRADASASPAGVKGPRTSGELVYAIGDVHGCYDLMKTLLAKIAEDSSERARGRRPILVFCGDYVDRGFQSNRVLEGLVWLKSRTELSVHLLKGNHEQAFLHFLDDPLEARPWLRNGGAATLTAYGCRPPDLAEGPEGWLRARDEVLSRMPASHLRLLERLETLLVIGDYVFVHAGVRPGRPLDRQVEEDLLWIRDDFLLSGGPFEKVVVHGHTWADAEPQVLEHRLGIDTGAYETGVLTAVRLDGEDRGFIRSGR